MEGGDGRAGGKLSPILGMSGRAKRTPILVSPAGLHCWTPSRLSTSAAGHHSIPSAFARGHACCRAAAGHALSPQNHGAFERIHTLARLRAHHPPRCYAFSITRTKTLARRRSSCYVGGKHPVRSRPRAYRLPRCVPVAGFLDGLGVVPAAASPSIWRHFRVSPTLAPGTRAFCCAPPLSACTSPYLPHAATAPAHRTLSPLPALQLFHMPASPAHCLLPPTATFHRATVSPAARLCSANPW